MEWEVLTTEEFGRWYHEDLTDEQAGSVDARVDMLAATGPTLSRPVVGAIETSRHRNMKELRCSKRRSVARPVCVRPVAPSDPADRRRQVGGSGVVQVVRDHGPSSR